MARGLKDWYLPEAERVISIQHEQAMKATGLSNLKVELQKLSDDATNAAHRFADNSKLWPHETGSAPAAVDPNLAGAIWGAVQKGAAIQLITAMRDYGINAEGIATFQLPPEATAVYAGYTQQYKAMKVIDKRIADAQADSSKQAAIDKWRKA